MFKEVSLAEIQESLGDWLTEIRRHLHQNPELSDQEHETQKFIMARLAEMGIPHQAIARTGVVALIQGQPGGKTVGLRADIDALPMEDSKDVPYRSQRSGACHACGHDAHTAMALGVARFFHERKDQFQGAVKIFFQPAEETIGGAKRMVEEGCMDAPKVDFVIGKHVMSYMETGEIEVRHGKLNAASDGIKITVLGRASHGAYPEKGVDALLGAAGVIQAVHTIVARKISPLDQAVITLGTIQGGTKSNTLCDQVVLTGTMRTTSEATRAKVKEFLEQAVQGAAAAYGATATIQINPGYNALINDDSVVDLIIETAQEQLGKEKVLLKEHPSLGVEDFSFFLNEAPGAFYHLGCGSKEKGITAPTHATDFDIDEACLALGVHLDICVITKLLVA